MKILGCRNCTIRLSGFGIKLIRRDGIFGSNFQEIICSLAGPSVNFLCFALLYAIGKAFSVWEHIIPFAQMNLALGLFNILPIFPLDGGNIVVVLLSMVYSDGKALKFSELISALFLMPIATIGFLVAIKTKYNFSLLILVVYLMAFLAIKKR
jgi:stage IV sporulation protein FB